MLQLAAIGKSPVAYTCHALRNCDLLQVDAIDKSTVAYACHALRNRDTFWASICAFHFIPSPLIFFPLRFRGLERASSDFCHPGRYVNVQTVADVLAENAPNDNKAVPRQTRAVVESASANVHIAARHRHVGKAAALGKRTPANARHAVGDHDTFHGATAKCTGADAGHGLTAKRGRNRHRADQIWRDPAHFRLPATVVIDRVPPGVTVNDLYPFLKPSVIRMVVLQPVPVVRHVADHNSGFRNPRSTILFRPPAVKVKPYPLAIAIHPRHLRSLGSRQNTYWLTGKDHQLALFLPLRIHIGKCHHAIRTCRSWLWRFPSLCGSPVRIVRHVPRHRRGRRHLRPAARRRPPTRERVARPRRRGKRADGRAFRHRTSRICCFQ